MLHLPGFSQSTQLFDITMRNKLLSVEEYVKGIRSGDRVILGRAITLVESARAEHTLLAEQVLEQLGTVEPSVSRHTIRIAITGVPGVGKSTFIEAFGIWLVNKGFKVAVLAIDPSSAVSKGSILGDKTRMEQLSVSDRAFIRPSPAGESLGGVARKTRETIILTEAAGFEVILVETVGVGQSEIAARSMCDLFMLLLLPGAGDELQGIKRGIVEMADLLVVNKADGDRKKLAALAQAHYINATHLLPPHASKWAPRVLTASSIDHTGLEQIWEAIEAFRTMTTENGYWEEQRRTQAHYWLHASLNEGLKKMFFNHPAVKEQLELLEKQVVEGHISPFAAARVLLDTYKNTDRGTIN